MIHEVILDQAASAAAQPAPELSPELSVVIPCFNEEENVEAICAAVQAELEGLVESWEILLIDNGSTDATRPLIAQLCAREPRIRAIFNTRNFGQMRSPTHGIYQARGRAVIGMCADFQDPPATLRSFVAHWRAGAEIVLGQRRTEKAGLLTTLARKTGYALLGRLGDVHLIPGATGFGLYTRRVVDALAQWNEPEPFFRGMLVESGFCLVLVGVDRPERAAGHSKNNFRTLRDFALSGLAGSAKSLLRAPIILSFYAALAAVLLLGGAGALALTGGTAWPLALAALSVGLFAVTLFFLGLIGDQVRLIAERTRGTPLVLEERRLNFPDHP